MNNSPIQDYAHPDDQTQPFEMNPGFKPFTVLHSFIAVFHSSSNEQLDDEKVVRDIP